MQSLLVLLAAPSPVSARVCATWREVPSSTSVSGDGEVASKVAPTGFQGCDVVPELMVLAAAIAPQSHSRRVGHGVQSTGH